RSAAAHGQGRDRQRGTAARRGLLAHGLVLPGRSGRAVVPGVRCVPVAGGGVRAGGAGGYYAVRVGQLRRIRCSAAMRARAWPSTPVTMGVGACRLPPVTSAGGASSICSWCETAAVALSVTHGMNCWLAMAALAGAP